MESALLEKNSKTTTSHALDAHTYGGERSCKFCAEVAQGDVVADWHHRYGTQVLMRANRLLARLPSHPSATNLRRVWLNKWTSSTNLR